MENYFFDDKWSEFVYNILKNLTSEQKMRLDGSELHLIKSDNKIKKFANTASAEQQMRLLTKLGYDWFFGVYPAGKFIPDVMKKAYRQHTIKDTRVDVMQEMINNHVFVIDNKAVALSLSMMAQNSHSDALYINREFLKVPALLEQFKKSKDPLAEMLRNTYGENRAAEYRDGIRSMEELNELVCETMKAEDYMESVMQISKLDFLILGHLFRHRSNYVSVDYLKRELGHLYPLKAIPIRCTYLFTKRNLIDKLPKSEPVSYTIKSDGILMLGELLNMIINRSRKA